MRRLPRLLKKHDFLGKLVSAFADHALNIFMHRLTIVVIGSGFGCTHA
jgi:hypothetical protein